MVESSKHSVRVQIDHFVILDIMKQNSIISTTSTMRMNVRLIRASQFLRQFDLDVRHKPGKEHILPDALSRLTSINTDVSISKDHSELDALFTMALMQMNSNFHDRCVQGYQEDTYWKRIAKQLNDNVALGEDAASLPFVWGKDLPTTEADPYFFSRPQLSPSDSAITVSEKTSPRPQSSPSDSTLTVSEKTPPAESELKTQSSPSDSALAVSKKTPPAESELKTQSSPSDSAMTASKEISVDDLIFHVDKILKSQRLCIPSSLVKKIFAITHGTNGHPGFQRCHEIVTAS